MKLYEEQVAAGLDPSPMDDLMKVAEMSGLSGEAHIDYMGPLLGLFPKPLIKELTDGNWQVREAALA